LSFYQTDNPHFLWFGKWHAAGRVLVVVNTDPHWTQQGWVQVPIWEMGIGPRERYVVHDLLDGARYTWRGEWNYVKLDPTERVAHVLVVRPSAGSGRPELVEGRDSGFGIRDSK
jgi:starch synthase (maltosyl-transferring)